MFEKNLFETIHFQKLVSSYVIPWSINILFALAIFFIGRMLARVLVRLLGKLLHKSGTDLMLVEFFKAIANAALLLLVIVAALDRLGVNTTSLVAMLGAAGLAVGLALQGSLQNFAAGVMLLLFRPFKAGDYVEAADCAGVIESIGIFTTTLRSADNKEIIIPNGSIYKGNIINYSARSTRRVDLSIGVGYQDDLRKVKQVLTDTIQADARVLKDPELLVAVDELAASSVRLVARAWVRSDDYWPVKFALTENIKLAFDANGISLPYPQMAIHLDKNALG
ncbi:mechanosensitive ion channel family protein [Herminiimonas sp. CN]|uniref:mechanosensitive ion channel family protein n=1 Tax=Herminiimonas sp. CN TaxID=1349818 RepID=UPI00047316B8|nr:mechanosensitive ion channel domain-containing protein [Herminiimonas sp. CN]